MISRCRPLFFAFIVVACRSATRDGYTSVAPDVELRLVALGEDGEPPGDRDSIRLRLRAAVNDDDHGSLLSIEQWYLTADLRSGALAHALERMGEGDSLSLITRSALVPWGTLARHSFAAPPDTSLIRVELVLIELLRQTEIEARAAERLYIRSSMTEQQLVVNYRTRVPAEWIQWGTSELFYQVTGQPSDTARVKRGELVTLSYTGKTLDDDRIVDDTGRNGHPFIFRFGDNAQVIRGLEVAVSLLRPGQQGNFILPSEMAFGTRGIEGIVPPNTPLVYTVRIEHIEGR
jgi:FKBP-type peptidyl-prolyl cis-trans isomerase